MFDFDTSSFALPARFSELAPVLDDLAQQAAAGIVISEGRCDPTFGRYGPLAALARSAVTIEGAALENGLRAILSFDGRFAVMPPDFRLPLVEAALAAVRSNEREALSSVRLDHKAYASAHYTPDLVVVRRDTGTAFILELKRTTSSYGKTPLVRIEQNMTASALVLRDVLFSDRRRLLVKRVDIGIVDCDGSDRRDLVIGMGDLDTFLDCPGVGDCMSYLRGKFALHVQKAFSDLLEVHGNPSSTSAAAENAFEGRDEDEGLAYPDTVAIGFARKRRLMMGVQG